MVVVDPLISNEVAAAALALYRRHRGDRPVTGVIYTHPHRDHFGGVGGVVTDDVPILAPAEFMRHAVTENVYAGGAMLRRGVYFTGLVDLDPGLRGAWYTHGYYGSVSHNVKAVYQRYLGWFDGNPAHLWEHPPVESARRYVETIGGVDAVVAAARRYRDDGDLRFAAQLLNHAVFADPAAGDPAPSDPASHDPAFGEARELLADVYTRLGFGAENGPWRNFYLTGAQELRHGTGSGALPISSGDLAGVLSVEQLLDSLAIRVDGPAAWPHAITLDWDVTDAGQRHRSVLSHGAFVHWADPDPHAGPQADARADSDAPDATVHLRRAQLLGLLGGQVAPDTLTVDGDATVLPRLLGLLDGPDPAFAIVTP